MKKVLIGIIIALLIVCAIVEGLFIYKQKVDKKTNENQLATDQNQEGTSNGTVTVNEGESVTVIKVVNESKPYIADSEVVPYGVYTSVYYDVIDKINMANNSSVYQYYIPQIYLNSKDETKSLPEDIQKINTEIMNEWKTIIEKMAQDQEINYSCEGLKYTSYYDDDEVMIIMLITPTEAGEPVLKTYNIDTKTGKQISNKDLLAKFDYSAEDVKSKVISAIDKYSSNMKKQFENDGFIDQAGEYDKIVNDAKKDVEEMELEDMVLYIDGSSKLMIYLQTYNIRFAGGDGTALLFNLETGEECLYELYY